MWRLVAHNHWFTLKFFGIEIRLCARCTGYYLGFFLQQLFNIFPLLDNFYGIEVTVQLIVSLLFIMPFVFDWVTQSWRLRESNNLLRFMTGGLSGVGVSLLSSINLSYNAKFAVYVCSAAIIFSLGIFGRFTTSHQTKSRDKY